MIFCGGGSRTAWRCRCCRPRRTWLGRRHRAMEHKGNSGPRFRPSRTRALRRRQPGIRNDSEGHSRARPAASRDASAAQEPVKLSCAPPCPPRWCRGGFQTAYIWYCRGSRPALHSRHLVSHPQERAACQLRARSPSRAPPRADVAANLAAIEGHRAPRVPEASEPHRGPSPDTSDGAWMRVGSSAPRWCHALHTARSPRRPNRQ